MGNLNFKVDGTPRTRSVSVTLRAAGYTNYSAIADIIDNSLESNVNSKNVYINLIPDGKGKERGISEIQIIDDGCGMTEEIIKEALKIGADTGKDSSQDLGCYGIGMKSAAISIGRKFEIWTKNSNDKLLIVAYDIDKIIKNDNFIIDGRYGSEKEFEEFKSLTKNDTGTIIKISNLDKIHSNNYNYYEKQTKKKLGEYFYYFIDAGTKIHVNGDSIKKIDLVGDKKPGVITLSDNENNTFEYNDTKIKLLAYYVPIISRTSSDEDYQHKRGLYIYRNNRLVGRGLSLGMVPEDHWYNGLRIKMFIDGSSDSIFNTTFTKEISEKDKTMLNEEFKDKLDERIKSFCSECKIRQKSEKKDLNGNLSDNESDIVISVLDDANTDNRVGTNVPKRGINDKGGNKPEILKPRGPQQNPPLKRNRQDEKVSGVEFVALGEYDKMFEIIHDSSNNKTKIFINTDHSFFNKFYSNLEREEKRMIIRLILSMYFAMPTITKHSEVNLTEEEKQLILEEYIFEISREFRLQTDKIV